MKKAIAAILSLFVGIFGYSLVDKTIEERVSNLEYEVSSLQSEVESLHSIENSTKTSAIDVTDIAGIVTLYNNAVIRTNNGEKLDGQKNILLDSDITGDGSLGAVLKVAMPIIEKTLKNSSGTQDNIPGKGKLKPEDVASASATSKDGVTTINIKLKNQTDGPNADSENGGPVSRGMGTLGNIEIALDSLGATISEGKENISLLYNDASITCYINENTGIIVGGEWHYKVNVFISEAKIKLGVVISATNLNAIIDWDVKI